MKRKLDASNSEKKMSSLEQGRSQGRGFNVFESSRNHERELTQQQALHSIASRLRPMREFCKKAISAQNKIIDNQRGRLGPSANSSQITELIQTQLPKFIELTQTENACNVLIDYTEKGKTDKDLSAAKDQIIGFLEASGLPGTPMHSLANDIRCLFRQPAQQEIVQAPSSSRDTGRTTGPRDQPSSSQDVNNKKIAFLDKIRANADFLSDLLYYARPKSTVINKGEIYKIRGEIVELCNKINLAVGFHDKRSSHKGDLMIQYGHDIGAPEDKAIRLRELAVSAKLETDYQMHGKR